MYVLVAKRYVVPQKLGYFGFRSGLLKEDM